jgi:acyl-coenzyme A thioesterase PaaI-like protein
MSTVRVVNQPGVQPSLLCLRMENPLGFRAQFYELENGELVALAEPRFDYQSYPGRLHGGIISTLADETMGRAIMIANPGIWGVTVDMTVTYQKPVPLCETLRIVARITNDRRI